MVQASCRSSREMARYVTSCRVIFVPSLIDFVGYGATTLPALTEALTLDQNVTLAAEEATRLVDLIDQLTDTIKLNP